jgi:glycosyltransferase EpsE
MSEYKISVIMAVYNCASTLQQALDSLYCQSYQNFKIILCDDGSTDDTLVIAEQNVANHKNVVLIKNETNKGLNFSLNHCLEYADTKYCARMDGDDISLPTRLEKEIVFLESNPEYAVVSTPMIYFDNDGDFRIGVGCGEISKMNFLHGTPICHAPCMFRTDAVKRVGGYADGEEYKRVEDYHLWFKLFSSGYKLFELDECLYKMRDDRNAKTRRRWIGRKNTFKLMNKGFRMISLPWWSHIFSLRPIITYLLPDFVYTYFHKR